MTIFMAAVGFSSVGWTQDTLFIDRTFHSGLQGNTDYPQMGIVCTDVNGDGLTDLWIATDREDNTKNLLFRNLGDGRFEDIGQTAGIGEEGMASAGGASGDYDGDGRLDLFVCNMELEEDAASGTFLRNRLFRNNGDNTYADAAEAAGVAGIAEGATIGWTSASFADYDADGDLDLLACNRFSGPFLYNNQGDGAFILATEAAGLAEEQHSEEEEHHEEEGEHHHELTSVEQAAWGDYDNDGDLDVFFTVALAAQEQHHHAGEEEEEEEHEEEGEIAATENRLFENRGDGTFVDATDKAGVDAANLAVSHCAVWGDCDNDGDLDLFVGNVGSTAKQTAANCQLYRNNGDGTFLDVAESAGIREQYYVFNANFVDVNNDGWLDLSLVYHPSHDDFPVGSFFTSPQPLWINQGDGSFVNINADAANALLDKGITEIAHLVGLSWFDLENDGDSDMIFTNNHGDRPLRLYENQLAAQENHSLTLRLKGTGKNPFAVGARIYVTANGQTQMRVVGLGNSGFGCQEPYAQIIGLGKSLQSEVKVRWPDGRWESFGSLPAGESHLLIEGQGAETDVGAWLLYR
ncbi:MAG: CRTAC1 family protein [Candidatus Omnitrophota bacterium]